VNAHREKLVSPLLLRLVSADQIVVMARAMKDAESVPWPGISARACGWSCAWVVSAGSEAFVMKP
jgi:hypothetical protein